MISRLDDLDRFYALLSRLRASLGGYWYLADAHGRSPLLPERGVYFFFEHGEMRANGRDLRLARVGTHAVSAGSQTTLANRLSQHKGTMSGAFAGGGNHRGSIFRLHIGRALLNHGGYPPEIRLSWGIGSTTDPRTRIAEYPLERDVSTYIGNMPLLWLGISDAAGKVSHRKKIEAAAIALVSNHRRDPIDLPSAEWLGHYASYAEIRQSGLWNVKHVDEQAYPALFDLLTRYVEKV